MWVDDVVRGGVGEQAGLKKGDEIVGWVRSSDGLAREATSLLEFWVLEAEHSARTSMELSVRRQGNELRITLPPGDWRLRFRPPLTATDEVILKHQLDAANRRAVPKRPGGGESRSALSVGGSSPEASAWILQRTAEALIEVQRFEEGSIAFSLAAESWPTNPVAKAFVLEVEARAFEKARQMEKSMHAYETAISLVPGASLQRARLLHFLGVLCRQKGDLAKAEASLRAALEIRKRLAPTSIGIASSLNNLGNVASTQGRIDKAESLYQEALAAATTARPRDELEEAKIFGNLGNTARSLGDRRTAIAWQTRSLDARRRLEPEGEGVALSLSGLAALSADQGDYENAERHQRESVSILERVDPSGPAVAIGYQNLGVLARDRGDLPESERVLRRALAIQGESSTRSAEYASVLIQIGQTLEELGRRDEADRVLKEALALREEQGVGKGRRLSDALSTIGVIAQRRGALPAARAYLQRALALAVEESASSRTTGHRLRQLGQVALEQNRPQEALRLLAQATRIYERLASGTAVEAETWHAAASAHAMLGRSAEALAAQKRAVQALDAQFARLGGTQVERGYVQSGYQDYFMRLAEMLVDARRPEDAFLTIERSRARVLLAMMAERDLAINDAPAALETERRRLDAEYDRTQTRLGNLDPTHGRREGTDLESRLHELRRRQAELSVLIRNASPKFAALRYPTPLDFNSARAALDAGTVLLSFSVGRTRTLVFVVSSGEALRVRSIPIGRSELQARVESFLGLMARGRSVKAPEPALLTQGRALYLDLVKPLVRDIPKGARVLVSPDGPLHLLPFAALVEETRPLRYLGEGRPLHFVVSATAYAEIRRVPKTATDKSVVFGAPSRRGAMLAGSPHSIMARAAAAEPLPYAAEEARFVATPFSSLAQILTGEAATETRAKALGGSLRFVHFATHGLLDRRSPLDSGIVLATPTADAGRTGDNGVLQAWEIFERIRLNADLVMLSACETGLGRDAGPEGLLGLVRAFQYAGARTVGASLWAVSDRSTAELMKAFYLNLAKGATKDQALQAAQRTVRSGSFEHPFNWAGFQLYGDWK